MERFIREVRRRVTSSMEGNRSEWGGRVAEVGARWVTELLARVARVRRPVTTVGLGVALIVPSAAMLIRGEAAPVEAMDPALLAVVSQPMEARIAAAKASEGAIAAAWREKALEREADAVSERFARRYGIPRSLAREITAAALEYGIEPRVAFGLVRTESSFRRTVVSYAGAVGYTQVLPSTARWIEPGTTRADLFDTRTNLRVGFKYLRYLLDKYDGNLRLALTAYNRGPGTVDRLLRQGRNPENGYARKVLS